MSNGSGEKASGSRGLRRLLVLVLVLGLLGGLGVAAYQATRALAPDQLRAEVEALLARATHGPVEIMDLRPIWKMPPGLEADGLWLYDGALTVEHARARLDPVSLLLGRPHLTRLDLDGAELRFTQDKDESWKPDFGDRDEPPPVSEASLAPMRVASGVARFLLTRPELADDVVVANGRLSFKGSGPHAASIQLVDLAGELAHSRLLGKASLDLQARWVEGRSERGVLAWKGSRSLGGRIDLTLSASGLELSALQQELRALVPELTLRGRLDGVAQFEGIAPGNDRYALSLTARELEARAGASADATWLRVPNLTADARLALDSKRLTLSDGHVGAGEWKLSLDGEMGRPFGPASQTRGRIAVENLSLDPEAAQSLVGWLPASVRESARDVVGRVREGRLVRGELSADAPLEQWSRALAGKLDAMLPALTLSADLDGVRVALQPTRELSQLSGGLSWSDGVLEVEKARALLDGQPLPTLDVRFRGLARVLASAESERAMGASAVSLPGVTPLHAVFQSAPDETSPPPPIITLDLDRFQHPTLLWPLRQVHAEVSPRADGLFVAIRSARWAGVPIEGEIDWTLEPERRLAVRLEAPEATPAPAPASTPDEPAQLAGSPAPPEPAGADDGAWATGHITIGATQGSFRQRTTMARLRAIGARVSFDDVHCALDPSGEITGSLELDLSRSDAVPYSLDAKLESGDLAALLAQRGVKGEPMSGTLEILGPLSGTLVPGQPLLHDANGALGFSLRDGTIPKTVPPVLALALASDSLNPFSSRDRIRYDHIDADLHFANGTVSTQALDVDGPDLRLFAAGEIGLAETPNPLRAELALFLFRQLDWALVKIPILNELLLGENKNLVAAYFKIVGTWQDPVAHAQPLLTMKDTAGGDILEGIPRVVVQGVKAIGGLLAPAARPPAQSAPAPTPGGSSAQTAPAPTAEPSAQGAPPPTPPRAGEAPAGS
ncbi:MAG TPA: AsmA-like C-terminal region-containing protein [Myxococcota bacterium]|nr:AsmA-like C-terminal region-containing protein [Myxococcota bacterium]